MSRFHVGQKVKVNDSAKTLSYKDKYNGKCVTIKYCKGELYLIHEDNNDEYSNNGFLWFYHDFSLLNNCIFANDQIME